jgi:hypothetical protein
MSERIWELHSRLLGGGIRTTPEGDADIDGLILSEKAYLLAMRDFRSRQLVDLVQRDGPTAAANQLIAHYGSPAVLQATGGRGLVATRGMAPVPIVRRSDEVRQAAAARR